jgi:protein disulfide-isomerase
VINRYTDQPAAAAPPAPYVPPPQYGQAPAPQAPAANAAAAPASNAGPYSMQPQFAGAAPPVAPAVAAAPQQQLVPSNAAPPVVLDGCCAVTMVETRKLKKADPQFGAVHRGRTYLFMSAAEQTKFLADPDRYAVILSGFDPVRFAKTGELVEGKREFGMMYQQKIYLMSDEAALNEFTASPQFFSTSAHQAMLRSETTGTQFR